jgi:formylglycine-generating enzyme required for sulfatase activity
MRAAGRHYVSRAALAAVVIAAVGYAILVVRDRERADAALARALKADYQNLPELIPGLSAFSSHLRPTLEALEGNRSAPPHDRGVAEILLYRDRPTRSRAEALRRRLLVAQPDEAMSIRDALAKHPEHAGFDELRRVLADESAEPPARLRAAAALAALQEEPWAGQIQLAAALAQSLLGESRRSVPRWLELLGPSGGSLVSPLAAACSDTAREPVTQSAAAEALAEILKRGRESETLARVTVEATPEAFRVLLKEAVSLERSDKVFMFLRGVIEERVDDPRAESRKDVLARRQAAAGIALAALGEPEALWPLLRHRADPRLRALLIQRLGAIQLPPRLLLDRLSRPNVDPIERQALLLGWAETHETALAASMKAGVVDAALALYRSDPHPGVHSAAELLLRRFRPEVLAPNNGELESPGMRYAGLRWEHGPNEHTFAILPSPLEFLMGAPPHEGAHYGNPIQHYRKIDRGLAVATREVSLKQLRAFDPSHGQDPRYGAEPECVALSVSWFAAVKYCNWLSAQAGISKKEWCYPENAGPGMVLSADAVNRSGFRLPTEAEWEYFCRAGTETARPFGDSNELLPRYAWTWLNSRNRAMPPGLLLPNEFGLFDVLGNAWEWCQDGPPGQFRSVEQDGMPPYPHGTKEQPAPDVGRTETVDSMGRAQETWRLLRGGAFSYAPDRARSAFRDWQPSGDTREYLGFRVVRTVPASPQ